jgi:hypothetical protein
MDCVSVNCINGLCLAPTCTDGIRNQGESATDCGGNNSCPRCATNATCTGGNDCDSRVCGGGVC